MTLHDTAGAVSAEAPSEVPPAVLAARQRLTQLADAPVGEHVEVFDEVHRLLQDALATLDEA